MRTWVGVDLGPDAGEPAAAAEERVEVRDLGPTLTFAASPSGAWLETAILIMPLTAPGSGDQQAALDPPCTWPWPGPISYSGRRKRSSGTWRVMSTTVRESGS